VTDAVFLLYQTLSVLITRVTQQVDEDRLSRIWTELDYRWDRRSVRKGAKVELEDVP
jgi:hypothetical protein